MTLNRESQHETSALLFDELSTDSVDKNQTAPLGPPLLPQYLQQSVILAIYAAGVLCRQQFICRFLLTLYSQGAKCLKVDLAQFSSQKMFGLRNS